MLNNIKGYQWILLVAVFSFASFQWYSVQTSSENQERLNRIKDSHFPILEVLDQNIVRLDKIKELFLESVMTGESTPVDDAKSLINEVQESFVQLGNIEPGLGLNISRLTVMLNEYMQSSVHVANVMANDAVHFEEGDHSVDLMNTRMRNLDSEISSLRNNRYLNFINTLELSQEAGANLHVLSIVLGLINLVFIGLLGYFVASNNRMLLTIEEQNATLEQRIGLRTLELKTSNELLIESEDRAGKANVAKSLFLANMSHEIRTPLNAIIGFTHIIQQKKTMKDVERNNKLEKISDSATHLLGIINDILDFSKIEAGKMSLELAEFDHEQVFNNVFTIIGEKVQEKGLDVVFDVDPDIPRYLMGDSLRLGQVLLNFASNAVKFSTSGVILLRAKLLNTSADDLEIRFEVVDTGVGLTDEQQGKLFNAFEQADDSTTRKYGGTGLGLAISKRIANLMGGEIGVDSVLGKGSTFWFTAHLRPIDESKVKLKINPESLKNKRVLVVDDLEEIALIHQTLLENMGVRVTTALSGEEAIVMAEEAIANHDPYKIVFMDWAMPGMNGVEAMRQISNLSSDEDSSNILVTGHSTITLDDCDKDHCFDSILLKPVSASQFYNVMLSVTNPSDATLSIAKETTLPDWSGKGCKVLIAEDNILNQEVMSDLLEAVGLDISIAGNGAIAIELLKNNRPDIILMDVQMPVLDGIEATKKIRESSEYRDLTILAMTANAFDEDKKACLDAGMNDHVAKPVDPNILYSTLRQWLPEPNEVTVDVSNDATVKSPACMDCLKKIPGLDVTAALHFMNGNAEKYIRTLVRYKDQQLDDVLQLRINFNEGDFSSAKRIVHTLKGISATLGITAVQKITVELEQALNKNEDCSVQLIDDLEQKQSEIIGFFKKCLPKESALPLEAPNVDKKQIEEMLVELKKLLSTDDFRSSEYVMNILPTLIAYFGNDASKLESYVSNYEFEDALEVVRHLTEIMLHGEAK